MVTDVWQDFSLGSATVDICSADHPLRGGGTATSPALIRSRFSVMKPAADDPGELLGLEGRKMRRVLVPAGQKLWLRAMDTQRDIITERS